MKGFRSWLPWLWTGAVGATSLAILVMAVQSSDHSARAAGIAIGSWLPALITALGSLIAVRQPKNRIAWLLYGIGFVVVLEFLNQLFLIAEPGSTSLLGLAAIAWTYVGLPSAFYMFLLIALVFPNDHFHSSRQAMIAWPGVILVPSLFLAAMFTEEVGPLAPSEELAWMVTNPIGFISPAWLRAAIALVALAMVVMAVGGAASLVDRYRRSSHVIRAQIRWMLLATLILGIGVVLVAVSDSSQTIAGALILQMAFVSIPISITIAITRYRLFEIDRIISRTLTYAIVVALLAGLFVGLVIVIGSFLPSDNPVVVAGATLTVAGLFNPLRRRTQRFVDRRFNRPAYQSELVAETFANKLSRPLSPQEIIDLWGQTVEEVMQPQATGIWLRDTETQFHEGRP